MRTATGTLATAITSKERAPIHIVLSDPLRNGSWAMDPGIARDIAADVLEGIGEMGVLTPFVESVDINEALATDLPAGARTGPGGYASAEATIVLAGQLSSGMRLAEAFSGFDNPLNTLAPRIGCPITIDLGMIGAVGPETVRPFVGKVRSCSVDSDAGTVTLVALDNRERFRTPVVLPVVFGDDHSTTQATSKRPGLNAQFLLDWIARRQGYYASPPIRTSCVLSATLHGSAQPEVGALVNANDWHSFPIHGGVASFVGGSVEFLDANSSGLLGLSSFPTALNTSDVSVILTPLAGLNTDNGSNVFAEWASVRSVDAATLLSVYDPTGAYQVRVLYGASGVTAYLTRGGAEVGSAASATLALDGNPHYIAVHWAMTAAGANVNIRVDGTTTTTTITTGGASGGLGLTVAQVAPNSSGTPHPVIQGLQVTTELYSAGMFNNAFVPTAILDASLNELVSTPTVDTSDPWLLVQQLADAEQGFANFDGNTFIFRNRTRLTGGAAVATITTDPAISFANLKQSASSDEAIDTVINYVTVGATPYVLDVDASLVWSLSEIMSVPGVGSVTIPVEFPGPLYYLASRTYRASQTADGTGGDITNLSLSSVAVTASSYLTTVHNPNAFTAYLVGNLGGGTPGEPNLTVVGRCTRPAANGYLSVATDAPSVALYGTQSLDLPENPWRQAAAPLAALASGLLAALKDPHPGLSDLNIVGDPRLQLGDRIRVADVDGLVLDHDFWCVGIKTRYSPGDGLAQFVSLRQT